MRRFIALVLAATLLVVACGEAQESTPTTTVVPSTTAPIPATVPPPTVSSEAEVVSTSEPPGIAALDVPPELVRGNTALALELFADLSAQDTGNVLLGPASISEGLALPFLGARGDTAAEMAEVLHYDLEGDALHKGFASLRRLLVSREKEGLELAVANRVFGQEGYGFLDSFLADLSRFYEAPLGTVDFIDDPEGARRDINQWTAEQTNDHITELFPVDTIRRNTRLVLVNATYLAADWFFPFNPDNTRTAKFKRADGSKVKVEMMNFNEYLPSARTKQYSAVQIPYTGGTLSMIVIVPRNLDRFIARLDPAGLEEVRDAITDGGIHLYLPKLELSYHTSLSPSLQRLGMGLPFGGGADFSGMTGAADLFIDEIEHETYVKIDEEGTEAAAATGTSMALSHGPTVRANRPFILIIQDDATGAILFIGKVTDPTS